MLTFSSHELDIARQQPHGGNGRGEHSKPDANGLHVLRVVSDSFPYEHETYYWTDEGHEHHQDGQKSINHVVDHGSNDAFLEALAGRSAVSMFAAIVLAVALIVLAGSVGLPRAEHAHQTASKI